MYECKVLNLNMHIIDKYKSDIKYFLDDFGDCSKKIRNDLQNMDIRRIIPKNIINVKKN